jgi:competence protein ComEA
MKRIATFFLPLAVLAQDDSKAVLERACTKCHSINATIRQRNSKERWQVIVDYMISRGAELTDPEADKLIDYLTKTFGPRVNVNKAAAQDLAKALDVTVEVATAVVEYRTSHGAFKTIEDLKAVPALAGKDIDSRRAEIEF